MKTPIENAQSKFLVGYDLIGGWNHNLHAFLTDVADLELRCALFFTRNQVVPEFMEDINTPEVDADLKNMKVRIKEFAAQAIARGIEAEQRQNKLAVEQAFVGMNKQDPAGSVKDLAAHYGVTIGEYSRLKREGRLDELKKTA